MTETLDFIIRLVRGHYQRKSLIWPGIGFPTVVVSDYLERFLRHLAFILEAYIQRIFIKICKGSTKDRTPNPTICNMKIKSLPLDQTVLLTIYGIMLGT